MKPYRLLRNNKETGPYSAEELIAMGLKAYDLVWVDGKSAAWRYPCEIAELKPYAPEAEDLATILWKPPASKYQSASAKENEASSSMKGTSENNEVSSLNSEVSSSMSGITQKSEALSPIKGFAQKEAARSSISGIAQDSTAGNAASNDAARGDSHLHTPKPRIRVRADWRKVEEAQASPVHAETSTSIPGNLPVRDAGAVPASDDKISSQKDDRTSFNKPWDSKAGHPAAGTSETMPQRHVNETKPDDTFVRVTTGPATGLKEEKAESHIKYSESLEDIKQRYNETVLQRKRPALTSRTGLLLLLVPVLCIGMWIGSGWTRDKQPKVQAAVADNAQSQGQQPQAASLQSVMADDAGRAEETAPAPAEAVDANAHNVEEAQTTGVPTGNTSEQNTADQAAANAAAATPGSHQVVSAGNPVPKNGAPAGASQPNVPAAARPAVNSIAGAKPVTNQNQVAGGKGVAIPQAGAGQHTTIAGLKVQGATEVAAGTPGKTIQQAAGQTAAQPSADKTTGKDGQAKTSQVAANGSTRSEGQPQQAIPQAAKTSPAVSLSKKQITDYVSVQEELRQVANGKEMKLHVKNITDIPVDLVVLDLQYYDGNGKFKKGETLYVNHLSANDAVALMAPAVKNAQRIDYKVSLLSIEKNGVYLIAE
ncbi:RodZ family helix-turn-helix domain-containing protein [Filimonas effusa]|uniref:DUF4339 domain-containing protein n=1 Tax=Filimonas effusa TaxID=2508721 RepID=A0A4Q1D9Q8_9BACT|nr:hypothetical protein [Filimonas effusa]RXK86122.1 hypothetical protein ESB13_04745 [Filimonas effusa]